MTAIPKGRVFVIAEAGVTNYGDPELAHRQVDAAADAEADAVKFQAWSTEELVSRSAAGRHAAELGHDWFQRLAERELSREALRDVQAHARERGITFFATAHDPPSLEFLVDELDVPWLKVGSGEASNWDFLSAVGEARRSVLVSFGLQSDAEAARAVEILRDAGAPEVVVLHTVTVYPTPAALAQLGRLRRLHELAGAPVGLSDHTVGTHVALAAVALGACAIEKHLTFDKLDQRSLDNPGALEPAEWTDFVRQIREVEEALGEPDGTALAAALEQSRDWAFQALVAAVDLPAGTVLERSHVKAKRPLRGGIPATELERIVGRTLSRAVKRDDQLTPDVVV
jgi:N,N'-diacetyllegionaminate synthase